MGRARVGDAFQRVPVSGGGNGNSASSCGGSRLFYAMQQDFKFRIAPNGEPGPRDGKVRVETGTRTGTVVEVG